VPILSKSKLEESHYIHDINEFNTWIFYSKTSCSNLFAVPIVHPMIKPFSILASITFLSSSLMASISSSDAGKPWESRKTKTVKPAEKADKFNSYGGWADHKVANPGYFRTIQKDNKWWFIDPEGHLFISVGVNSVEPKRVGRNADASWAKDTHKLLTETGFNTIGRWSAPKKFKDSNKKIPYCSTFGFMKHYVEERPASSGKRGYPKQTIPVFDKEWPEFCERYAANNVPKTKDDKFLLGHFSDNELPFRPDALGRYLSLPESDAGHQAAKAWLKEKRISRSKIDDPKVQAEFLQLVAEKYFDTVAKKYDPNHLYIGSRLHGRCINEPVIRGANVCDVISINYYHAWEPDEKETADWTKWSEKPFIVGEFYAMKVTSKQKKVDGAGFRVLKHEEAGEFYHTYTSTLLNKHPNCVGWHWFKYADSNTVYRKGIVGPKSEVHSILTDSMRVLNEQVYSIRDEH